MDFVKHKMFGIGQVVSREGNYITVKFDNIGEKKFIIPKSFQLGILTAEGNLKNEIDAAIKENKKTNSEIKNGYIKSQNTDNRLKKTVKIEVVGKIATDYEAYLIKKGYKKETETGLPSTVYAYIKAVDFVLNEENLSWTALVDKINIIIRKYDIGGEKEHLGNKSNKTVINALKRFRDYVNQL